MNAISRKLLEEVTAILNDHNITVTKADSRGNAFSCSTKTETKLNKEYVEANLYVGRPSATRYDPVEARLFSKDVQELVVRLENVTKDFRVAVFENALPTGRHSFTLEIVLGYRGNILAVLCFGLDHDDERNWDRQVVEMLLQETYR